MSFISTELTNYLKQCNLTEQQQTDILYLIENHLYSSIKFTPIDVIDLIPYYSWDEAIEVLEQFKQYDKNRIEIDYEERIARDFENFVINKNELPPPQNLVILVEGILMSKFGVDFTQIINNYGIELFVQECWRKDKLFLKSLLEFKRNYDISKIPDIIINVFYSYIDFFFKTPEQLLTAFSKESKSLSDTFQHYFNNYIQERYNYNSSELLKLWSNFDLG